MEEEADHLLEMMYEGGVGGRPPDALSNRVFESGIKALIFQLRANRISGGSDFDDLIAAPGRL